ncbi:hypothetical protein [Devosia sp.]|uniref:hypothetical protein n=1 Tax=Devosia sp. TaxID=1871048 RepID=UPI0025BCFF8C|nr:hypothetical protein [Devosia sp.]
MGDSTKLPDDEPLTLAEACKVIFKGAISPDTLMAEASRGRLIMEKIGRRWFVTPAAIREMRKKCEVVQPAKARASGSNRGASETESLSRLSGSSETDRINTARDAARMKLRKLNDSLPTTSLKNTSRRQAVVIPLKS